MRSLATTAITISAVALLLATPTTARSDTQRARGTTGLESLHVLKRVGNKLCMANHFHYGMGDSRRSKAHALIAAKRAWARFAGGEYGSAWGRFDRAASKSSKCSRRGGKFHCSVQARPCRLLRRR